MKVQASRKYILDNTPTFLVESSQHVTALIGYSPQCRNHKTVIWPKLLSTKTVYLTSFGRSHFIKGCALIATCHYTTASMIDFCILISNTTSEWGPATKQTNYQQKKSVWKVWWPSWLLQLHHPQCQCSINDRGIRLWWPKHYKGRLSILKLEGNLASYI